MSLKEKIDSQAKHQPPWKGSAGSERSLREDGLFPPGRFAARPDAAKLCTVSRQRRPPPHEGICELFAETEAPVPSSQQLQRPVLSI